MGKQHDWNDLEILALGNRVQVAVNGAPVIDWSDPEPDRIKAGPIGLQLHSNKVPAGGPVQGPGDRDLPQGAQAEECEMTPGRLVFPERSDLWALPIPLPPDLHGAVVRVFDRTARPLPRAWRFPRSSPNLVAVAHPSSLCPRRRTSPRPKHRSEKLD